MQLLVLRRRERVVLTQGREELCRTTLLRSNDDQPRRQATAGRAAPQRAVARRAARRVDASTWRRRAEAGGQYARVATAAAARGLQIGIERGPRLRNYREQVRVKRHRTAAADLREDIEGMVVWDTPRRCPRLRFDSQGGGLQNQSRKIQKSAHGEVSDGRLIVLA